MKYETVDELIKDAFENDLDPFKFVEEYNKFIEDESKKMMESDPIPANGKKEFT